MSKIDLLQVGPYPEWDEDRLNATFTMHRYFEAADKAAFLAEHGGTELRPIDRAVDDGAGKGGLDRRGSTAAMQPVYGRIRIVQRHGAETPLSTEQVRIEARASRGSMLVAVVLDDDVVAVRRDAPEKNGD